MQTLQCNMARREIWILLNELPCIDNSLLIIQLNNEDSFFIVEDKLIEKLLLSTNKCSKVYLTADDWQKTLSGKDYSLIGNLNLSPVHFVDLLTH
jgi:hypothetical protein